MRLQCDLVWVLRGVPVGQKYTKHHLQITDHCYVCDKRRSDQSSLFHGMPSCLRRLGENENEENSELHCNDGWEREEEEL